MDWLKARENVNFANSELREPMILSHHDTDWELYAEVYNVLLWMLQMKVHRWKPVIDVAIKTTDLTQNSHVEPLWQFESTHVNLNLDSDGPLSSKPLISLVIENLFKLFVYAHPPLLSLLWGVLAYSG